MREAERLGLGMRGRSSESGNVIAMDFAAWIALRFDCSLSAIPMPFPRVLTRSEARGRGDAGLGPGGPLELIRHPPKENLQKGPSANPVY